MRTKRWLVPVLAAAVAPWPSDARAQETPEPPFISPVEIVASRARLGFSFTADEDRVVIGAVLPGSPAMRAGVQHGDTLVRVNGRDADARVMLQLGRRLEPGDTVRVQLRRAGRDRTLRIVAEERPPTPFSHMLPRRGGPGFIRPDSVERLMRVFMDSARRAARAWTIEADSFVFVLPPDAPPAPGAPAAPEASAAPPPFRMLEAFARSAVAGAEFAELNAELGKYFGGTREGLLVLRVAPRTPADRAGLRPGDVVVAVEDQPVRALHELRHAIAVRGGTATLEIVREGSKRELRLGRK